MKLYYNKEEQAFTTRTTDSSVELFETHERIGISNGKSTFSYGRFSFEIFTNFYPKAPQREYIRLNIFVDGVKLLPISLACRKAYVNYHFNEHQISFVQLGAGQHIGITPHTYVKLGGSDGWREVLQQICLICNDYKKWMSRHILQLAQVLEENNLTRPWHLATFLSLTRRYECFGGLVKDSIQSFADKHCFNAMDNVLQLVATTKQPHNRMTKGGFGKDGDVIWCYIKDYWLQ